MKKTRFTEIDILKGIGIIFVIMGHMGSPEYLGNSIVPYIYSFHMPLFFLCSGYLAYNKKEDSFSGGGMKSGGFNDSFFKYFKIKVIRLLIPYTCFFIFSFIWTNTICSRINGIPFFSIPFTWADMFKAFFLSGGYLTKVPINNFPLWFLPLLFISYIAFYFLVKVTNRKLLIAITLLIAFVTIPFQSVLVDRPAFHINVLPAALVYMLVGYIFHLYKEEYDLEKINSSLLGVFLLICGYVISLKYNGTINHINSYVYFIGSIITIYGYYMLALESSNKILIYVGRNSLYIFALHQLVISSFSIFHIDTYFIERGQDGIMVYAIQILSILTITVILTVIIKCFKSIICQIGKNMKSTIQMKLEK